MPATQDHLGSRRAGSLARFPRRVAETKCVRDWLVRDGRHSAPDLLSKAG